MNKLDKLAAKLRILGYDIEICAEDAIIEYNKSRENVVCYTISKDGILSKKYDSLYTADKFNSAYYIGIDGSNSHILDKHLVIRSKYYDEQIKLIAKDIFVIAFRQLSNSYRLSTVDGVNLSDGIFSEIKLWNIGTEIIAAQLCRFHGQDEIITANKYGILSSFYIDSNSKVYMGVDKVGILDSDNTLKIKEFNGTTKLVIKKAKVRKITYKTEDNIAWKYKATSVYEVSDTYFNTITEYEVAFKLN